MKLTEALNEATTRVAITGLPGSGKSTLAAQLAADGFHLIWISLDNDIDVLKKLPPEAQENVDVYNIPDSAAFPVGSQTCLQLFKEQKGGICLSHGVWNCPGCRKTGNRIDPIDLTSCRSGDIVVLDTGTQLGNSILAHVTKGQPVDYKPERDDWGGLRKFTEFFASQFQAAKFNLIVIFHVIEAKQIDDRTKLVPNFGSQGMSAMVAKAFSHVVYCEVVNKKHRAFSASTATAGVLTKSRTDFCIENLPNPSLAPIFAQIRDRIPESSVGVSDNGSTETNVVTGESTRIVVEQIVPVQEIKQTSDLLARLKMKGK